MAADHVLVVQNAARLINIVQMQAAQTFQMARMAAHDTLALHMARRHEEGLVKHLVQLLKGRHIAGLVRNAALQGDDAAQTGEGFGRDLIGQTAHDFGLKRDAHELRLADRRHIDRRDQRARLRVDLDQPLFGQLLQRIAQRRQADAMGLGQFGTQQRCAGRQVEPYDLIAQGGVNPASRGPALEQSQVGPTAKDAFGKGLCALRGGFLRCGHAGSSIAVKSNISVNDILPKRFFRHPREGSIRWTARPCKRTDAQR